MKKTALKILVVIAALLIVGGNALNTTRVMHANELGINQDAYMIACEYADMMRRNGEEYAANNYITLYQNGDGRLYGGKDNLIIAINALKAKGYVTEVTTNAFANAGIMSASTSSQANTNASTQDVASKTEFTITECAPYPAWATKDCNIRSGADTTYDKAGSLKKFEQVTVTGTASTGWFRITTADGKEAYISNTLLTTEDPTKVSLTTVTEEGVITEHTVEGDNPEAVAQVVEQIKEESEPKEEVHEHSYTSSVTTEPTCSTVGTMTYTCECGDTYTEEIPKVEHTPGEWETTKKAALLSDGEKVQKCTVCGEVLATEVIPANKTMLYVIIGACVAVVAAIVGVIIHKKKH